LLSYYQFLRHIASKYSNLGSSTVYTAGYDNSLTVPPIDKVLHLSNIYDKAYIFVKNGNFLRMYVIQNSTFSEKDAELLDASSYRVNRVYGKRFNTSGYSYLYVEKTDGDIIRYESSQSTLLPPVTLGTYSGAKQSGKYYLEISGSNITVKPYSSAAELKNLSDTSGKIDYVAVNGNEIYYWLRTPNGTTCAKTLTHTLSASTTVTQFLWYQYSDRLVIRFNNDSSMWTCVLLSETVVPSSNLEVSGFSKMPGTVDGNGTGVLQNFSKIYGAVFN